MTDRLRALSLLAGREAAGAHFFEVAARALVLGIGCRWAGFGKLAGSKADIDIIAFCDGGAAGPCFSYSLNDSPCGQVYEREPEDPFCNFPEKVTDLFSGPEVLQQIGAYCYRGEAMFDPTGTPLAHVFTIHDGPQDWSDEDVAFFRMVAQRAGSEYNRLQAEAALIAAKDRAEASDRAKTQFLTNTSHELRTPLNSIIGLSELLVTAGPSTFEEAEVLEYLGQMRKSGHALLGMIDDLLDISRIEMGYVELDEAQTDMQACFSACHDAIQGMLLKQGVTLSIEKPAYPIALFVDERALVRILINLVGNAVKFSHQGGRVTLSARRQENGSVEISVQDHGIGIADSDLEKVLSYFGQVDAGLGRAYSGTGIGLPLSKQLVELHGGTLKLESAVGLGTTVTVTLPKARVLSGGQDAASSAA